MTTKDTCHFLFVGLLASALFHPSRAQATLGEPISSIETNPTALLAMKLVSTAGASYSVYEHKSGPATVREYASPNGIVFAVAWTGYKHPELPPLLGTYSKDYQKAQSQTPKRRGARNYAVRTDRLVVEMGGHQRGGNLHGRAYDPTSVPSEVSIDEIK